MSLEVELDPIGPDGQPSETTVWCPACEEIYRVPFAHRYNWMCACTAKRQAELNLRVALVFDVPPVTGFALGTICEWVRVNAAGKRVSQAELDTAIEDHRLWLLGRKDES